jgi:enoyl-CoA hydratase/carnithine racemase
MAKPRYVSKPKLEDYKKQFADKFEFERKNGILQVRMHTEGGHVKWSYQMHNALAEVYSVIGHDPENEVLIWTSTDPYWIADFDREAFHEVEVSNDADLKFNLTYHDSVKIVENFINDINIPTIGAINGPGLHWEMAMMADITLCTPDFRVRDDHFGDATVPGDGQGLILQTILGVKRANYMMYMVNSIDAQTCLDWGLVNEILPKEQILPRAWEIAEKIMKQPRPIRRLTKRITSRPWKRMFYNDFDVQIANEFYGFALTKGAHNFDEIKGKWTDAEKDKLNKK